MLLPVNNPKNLIPCTKTNFERKIYETHSFVQNTVMKIRCDEVADDIGDAVGFDGVHGFGFGHFLGGFGYKRTTDGHNPIWCRKYATDENRIFLK